jgi:hypothetical protein
MNRIHKQSGVYLTGKLLGFPALINLYSESIRLSPPIHQGRFAYGTTFQGRNPNGTEADNANSGNSPTYPTNPGQSGQFGRSSRQKRPCLCESGLNGGYHRFEDCPYINPSVRTPNWQLDPSAEDRFKEACKNFRYRTAYKRTIARY